MKIEQKAEYVSLGEKGRIIIRTTVDGEPLQDLIVCSGPCYLVKDYFDGIMTLEEFKNEIFKPSRPTHPVWKAE